jgi:hypothetical protein
MMSEQAKTPEAHAPGLPLAVMVAAIERCLEVLEEEDTAPR